jgi:hypothetical protein
MEGWLSLSIYLSAAILLLSLLGCLPDVISSSLRWLQRESLSDQVGVASGTEQASVLVVLCEALLTVSAAYLVVALFIKSHTRQGPQ